MNGYVCFYKSNRKEVYAETSYEAQIKAAAEFRAKKAYQVNVFLAETNVVNGKGEPVVHTPTM